MNKVAGLTAMVLLTIAVSFFAGCGGGENDDPIGIGLSPPGRYPVLFVSNGGSFVPHTSVPYTGGMVSAPGDPTRMRYDFNGWYRDSELTDAVTFPVNVTQSITLYAGWLPKGDEIGVIEISSPAELYDIRYDLAGSYILTADISLEEYGNWEPIGFMENPFTGKIDGNGYKIKDLKIDETSESIEVGLFGFVRGGVITGLALENVDIIGGHAVGAIAGRIWHSEMTNCYSSGNIAASMSGSRYAGGIAGDVAFSTLTDCYSTAEITSSSNANLGGIAGSASNSSITNCYSTGNIFASASDSYSYAGGIAGSASNSGITNCYSTGDVTSSHSSGSSSYAGGIAGFIVWDTEITNCYSTGNITASISGSAYSSTNAGGIAGVVGRGTISNCYSTGVIISSSSGVGANAGGIAGLFVTYGGGSGTITNCAAINKTINAGTTSAGRIAGIDAYSDASMFTVSNNFALDAMDTAGPPFDPVYYGVSRTDAELRMQTTYSDAIVDDGAGGLGWKFGNDDENPWQMPVGGGYPVLYRQYVH